MPGLSFHLLDLEKIIIFSILLITIIYYMLVWYRYGRDPDKGTIIPLFTPPNGLSPSAVRYLYRLGYDKKAFTATIVNLEIKGLIKIVTTDNNYDLIQASNNTYLLTDEEKKVFYKLFQYSNVVHLFGPIDQQLDEANSLLKKSLENKYLNVHFFTNTRFLIPGISLIMIALIISAMLSNDPASALASIIFISIFSISCFVLYYFASDKISDFFRHPSYKKFQAVRLNLLVITLFLLPTLYFFCSLVTVILPPLTGSILTLTIITNIIFYYLMRARTIAGQKIFDQIRGFNLFLSTTEYYRLKMNLTPEQSLELMSQYLPYAIALDVENKWETNFNDCLINSHIQQSSSAWTADKLNSFHEVLTQEHK